MELLKDMETIRPTRDAFEVFDVEDDRILVGKGTWRGTIYRNCTCNSCQSVRNKIPNLAALIEDFLNGTSPEIARRRAKIAATEKSEALFLRLLSEEERTCYQTGGYIRFTSQLGRLYTLAYGFSNNIRNEETGRRYCCYLNSPVPIFDHMVGQYLALKYNENLFLSRAY